MSKRAETPYTIDTLITRIEARLRLLQTFEGKGPNPSNYVQEQASRAETDLKRLKRLLEKI